MTRGTADAIVGALARPAVQNGGNFPAPVPARRPREPETRGLRIHSTRMPRHGRAAPERQPMTERHWIGEAQAAFDESLPHIDGFGAPEIWLQRAQAAAAIAAAEQSRIANLIAWKQLQATRAASSDAGVGMLPLGTDETADEIEQALGITPTAEPPVQIGGDL